MNELPRDYAGYRPEDEASSSPVSGQPQPQLPYPFSSRSGTMSPGQAGTLSGLVVTSAYSPGISTSRDGAQPPQFGDVPALISSWNYAGSMPSVRELIREVDAVFGPPWDRPELEQPADPRAAPGYAHGEYVLWLLRQQRREYPGVFERGPGNSLVYVERAADGQVVTYYSIGRPAVEWHGVPPATDFEQANEQHEEEVPVEDELAGFLSDVQPEFLLAERWQHPNPQPESPELH
ncbi:hypothetical protein CH35J_002044 [Colletotrichum higginsianum]|uniref:Uncharacterized protein n=1 Tax=Colletotrichum higginsianum TaxID=80884 RepID=A0A4T0WFQ1_9PEZI|nr:hypothetical protein CH35J_002044 [Colletotrichum higginsianum]